MCFQGSLTLFSAKDLQIVCNFDQLLIKYCLNNTTFYATLLLKIMVLGGIHNGTLSCNNKTVWGQY